MNPGEPSDLAERAAREREHYDEVWSSVEPVRVSGRLRLPVEMDLHGKRVLVCACGTGIPPVLAAQAGAEVHTIDISPVAVRNARRFADLNEVVVNAEVMDLNAMTFRDGSFDLVYGSAVLHHIDPAVGITELHRVLRPGGVAFFADEPSDRNPILRYAKALAFGGGRGPNRKERRLFLHRIGSPDDAPLDRTFENRLREVFGPEVRVIHSEFVFFRKLSDVMRGRLHSWTEALDRAIDRWIPFLRRYSYHEDVLLRKIEAPPIGRD